MNNKKKRAVTQEMIEAAREKRKAEAAKLKAKIAKKRHETVAITVSLVRSRGSEGLKDLEDLVKIASDIITGWEDSSASTVDIESLKENRPLFGVLDERSGRKIYAFFDSQEGPIIKKLVVPLCSGVFHDENKVIPLIEKHFPLIPVHRKKTTK